MRSSFMIASLVLVIGASSAVADSVILKNGGRIDGIASEKGDRVRIETEFGAMEIPRDTVHEIMKGPSKLEEYRKKAAALADTDIAGHFALGQWALSHELTASARREFEKTVALDPNHEGARLQLGFEKVDGKWLAHDEAMRAKGFILDGGQWITKEEFELRQALAKEAALREEVRLAEERERQRQAMQARLDALADARAAALEEENARLRSDYDRRYYGGGGYGYGYGGFSYGYGGYGYGYGRVAPVAGSYLDQFGTPVSTYVGPDGRTVWTRGESIIHVGGDGHRVFYNPFTGMVQHYPTGSGVPDISLWPSSIASPATYVPFAGSGF